MGLKHLYMFGHKKETQWFESLRFMSSELPVLASLEMKEQNLFYA